MKTTASKKQTTRNLDQCVGLWVAFVGKEIISSADTLKKLAEKTQIKLNFIGGESSRLE